MKFIVLFFKGFKSECGYSLFFVLKSFIAFCYSVLLFFLFLHDRTTTKRFPFTKGLTQNAKLASLASNLSVYIL